MLLTAQDFDQLSEFHEKVIDYRDIFKPPTLVTLGGLGLVLYGSTKIDTMAGMNMIVAGRSGDLLDGVLARVLQQESDLGALTDTAADKIGLAAIGTAAWIKEAAPRPVLATMAARHSLSVGLTAATALNHPGQGFRPNAYGKLSMAADNIALLGYGYSNALAQGHDSLDLSPPHYDSLKEGAQLLGRVAFAAGNILSVPATIDYAQRARR